MALYIYDYLVDIIEKHLKQNEIKSKVNYYIGRAWQKNRFIQVIIDGWDVTVHFEYINGFWELHFESDDADGDSERLRKYLIENFEVTNDISWHRWHNKQRGLLRYEYVVEDVGQFTGHFTSFYNLLAGYLVDGRSSTPQVHSVTEENKSVADEYKEPEVNVISINNLQFDKYRIPDYQRPYKWTARNVNQLIDDIIYFKDNNVTEYRLGTLVLHKSSDNVYDIVDGQQRILTISLLLKELWNDKHYEGKLTDVRGSVEVFTKRKSFTDDVTKRNLSNNLQTIRHRLADIDDKAVDFILSKCKFVVVTLYDISEAFQFFDSQNARGKELVPHDLLKAFHLRDIPKMLPDDLENIETWESYNESDLAALFLVLFRIKRWINAKDGKFFTSRDVDTFKGLSASSNTLPYQKIFIMAECFTKLYNQDVSRVIDGSHMDYPHQIDQVIINGRLFFDMISHYMKLYGELADKLRGTDIIRLLDSYGQRKRAGDVYTRALFNAAMLFYYDKFGCEKIDSAEQRIFAWAYSLRLRQHSVQLASIDRYARDEADSFFTFLHQAVRPHELMNWTINAIAEKDIRRTEMKDIINKMKELKYVQ